MKEVTRVHLAKTPYSIELDAKKELEKYLHDIERVMKAEPEAIQEIEARFVELLSERGVAADGVISAADVAMLREKMGEPREFSEGGEEGLEATEVLDEKPVKRLMRDRDNAILGGVCSGIAAYFGRDVLIVRLIMIALLIISAGTFLFIYIVFWIVIPPARSAADRLTMAGRPVTLEALKASSELESQPSVGAKLAARIARFALGAFVLLAAAGTLVAVLVGGFVGYQGVSWMTDFSAQPWAFGVLASLFVGGMALVVLLGLMTYAVFSWTMKRTVGLAALVMLLVGTLAVTGVAISGFQATTALQKDKQTLTKVEKIELPVDISKSDTVNVVGAQVAYGVVSADSPRAELRYWALKGTSKPTVSVEKWVDGTVWITVESPGHNQVCPALFRGYEPYCSGISPEVVLYGMSLHSNESAISSSDSPYHLLD